MYLAIVLVIQNQKFTTCVKIPFTLTRTPNTHHSPLLFLPQLLFTHSSSHFSCEIRCLPYRAVLGIFGLNILAALHWKLAWDVKVLFILSNSDDIDHFQTYSIVFKSYCAIYFFPLLMYQLTKKQCSRLLKKVFVSRKFVSKLKCFY